MPNEFWAAIIGGVVTGILSGIPGIIAAMQACCAAREARHAKAQAKGARIATAKIAKALSLPPPASAAPEPRYRGQPPT